MGKTEWHFFLLVSASSVTYQDQNAYNGNECAALSPISSENWFLDWSCFQWAFRIPIQTEFLKNAIRGRWIFVAWCHKQIYKLNWRKLLDSALFYAAPGLSSFDFSLRLDGNQMPSHLATIRNSAPGLCFYSVTLSLKFTYSLSPK